MSDSTEPNLHGLPSTMALGELNEVIQNILPDDEANLHPIISNAIESKYWEIESIPDLLTQDRNYKCFTLERT